MHLDLPSVMEFLTTDFQLSDGKGGMLESVAVRERRGSGMSSNSGLSFGEGLIPATSLEALANEFEMDQVVLNSNEETGNIDEMKMDFEAMSPDDTETNLMSELRRQKEKAYLPTSMDDPFDEPVR